jgi:hypothetical protein
MRLSSSLYFIIFIAISLQSQAYAMQWRRIGQQKKLVKKDLELEKDVRFVDGGLKEIEKGYRSPTESNCSTHLIETKVLSQPIANSNANGCSQDQLSSVSVILANGSQQQVSICKNSLNGQSLVHQQAGLSLQNYNGRLYQTNCPFGEDIKKRLVTGQSQCLSTDQSVALKANVLASTTSQSSGEAITLNSSTPDSSSSNTYQGGYNGGVINNGNANQNFYQNNNQNPASASSNSNSTVLDQPIQQEMTPGQVFANPANSTVNLGASGSQPLANAGLPYSGSEGAQSYRDSFDREQKGSLSGGRRGTGEDLKFKTHSCNAGDLTQGFSAMASNLKQRGKVSISAYFVEDGELGDKVFEQNGDDPQTIASIVKLVTAYTLYRKGVGDMNQKIKISSNAMKAHNYANADADDSNGNPVKAGSMVTKKELLKQMLVTKSSNVAAFALMESVSDRATNKAHGQLLNETMTHLLGKDGHSSNFENAHGLNDGGLKVVSSTKDLVSFQAKAFSDLNFRKFLRQNLGFNFNMKMGSTKEAGKTVVSTYNIKSGACKGKTIAYAAFSSYNKENIKFIQNPPGR